jgi:hypothetical protein
LTGPDGGQILTRIVKRAQGVVQEQYGPCKFVPLVGRFGATS